jgi:hypothetical protein
MDPRKEWTQRQTLLRKLLSGKENFTEGMRLFLEQHAAAHSAAISGGQGWSLQDETLAGLSDDQVRVCPRKGNSIAWLLWHTARIEDVTLNFLVLGRPQVFVREDWPQRLGAPVREVGNAMDREALERFSAQVCVPALIEYRAAVGRSARAGIAALQPAQLKEIVPSLTVQCLVEDGSIPAEIDWLARFYSERPKGFFLTRITSHNFLHIQEAYRLSRQLLRSGAAG